ncbi:hypothetical protein [Pseudoalteromonas mariniglutinosa]|uniref:hypothetical protein n=1 Tax=Pseudoalteromonas mariniglutinosa TaxID=206042 RepID=UPI00384E4E0D
MRNKTLWKLVSPVLFIAGLTILSGCQSTEERERIARQNDSQTCIEFGTKLGTSEYSECMLRQQERRDKAALVAAELQRAYSETTKNNIETVRRLGCEREAEKERKRGEKPRNCL